MSEQVEQGRSEALKQDVFEVCDKLFAAREKMSVRAIKAELPHIKSTSTIHKYLAMWKDLQQSNQDSLFSQVGLSENFITTLMNEVTRFGAEAERRYKEQAKDAIAQRNEAIDDLTEVDDRYIKQSALVESQADQITGLKAEAVLATQNHENVLDKQKANFHTIEKELRTQIQKLQEDLRASTASNETLRTDLAKAELKLESNETLVSQIEIQHQDEVSKNEMLAKRNGELNQQLATQTEKANNAESSITKLEGQNQGLQKEISTLRRSVETTTSEKQAKETELATIKAKSESSNEMIQTLQGNMFDLNNQLKSLRESKEHAEYNANATQSKLEMLQAQHTSLQQKLDMKNVELDGVKRERDALKINGEAS